MQVDYEALKQLTGKVIESCIYVHKELGPGLFESVYEEVLCYRFLKQGLNFERQVGIPVVFEGVNMEMGFRSDIIVEKTLIIEIKSIEAIAPVHKKQLLTYLKLANMPVGLLINFNEELLKNGIKRILNTQR